MSCSNCFNGCAETISDQCIKYTGINVPELGILHGDSLLSVENAIVNFLVPVLNGTGIKPIIDNNIICNVVSKYLPTCTQCTGFTLNEVLTAIIKATCDLQDQIDLIVADIAEINADYTLGCVTGVTSSGGTHNVLQATINKLCAINTTLNALILQLNSYVPILASPGHPGVNDYIEAYINSDPTFTLYSSRMIPYVAVPYFAPSLSNFDASGAGLGNYARIFLCNGQNPGVPDLRGRTLVGATTMSAAAFNPVVQPGGGNPTYSLNTTTGANQITLGVTQIPSHTHVATTTIVDPKHRHNFSDDTTDPTNSLRANNDIIPLVTVPSAAQISADGTGTGMIYQTSESSTNISVSVSNSDIGGNLPHSNIQPVHACYYIIYIP